MPRELRERLHVVRMPRASNDFLKVQIGFLRDRAVKRPVYSGRRVIAHKTTHKTDAVFHLVGYGATIEDAKRMALQHGVDTSNHHLLGDV